MNQKEELLALIEQIKAKEEKVWKDTKNMEDEQTEADLEMAKLEQDIASEKDLVTGKPVYSNEGARRTALKLALKDNNKLQESLNHIRTERNAIKLDEIEFEAMKRKFSILKRLLVPIEPIKVDVISK